MTNIITPQDLADYAPDLDTSGFSATTLSGMISMATNRMAQFCNVKGFDLASENDEGRAVISNRGELQVALRRRPFVSISNLTLKRGGFSTTLTLTDSAGRNLYNVPEPHNTVYFPNTYLYLTGTFLAGGSSQLLTLKAANMFYSVDYVGGLQTIPPDLKDAAVLWMRDLINRRQNPLGAQSFSQGSYSVNFGTGGKRNNGDSIFIQQAKSMLTQGGYVRVEQF